MRVLAVSGSLRDKSTNGAVVRAAIRVAPAGMAVEPWKGVEGLPHFSPDLDGRSPPAPVVAWRAELTASDALVVSSPEYAHGIPGSLKNALDWIVASGELSGMPIALMNATPGTGGSHHMRDSLVEVLKTMDGWVVADAGVDITAARTKVDAAGELASASDDDAISRGLTRLADAVHERRARRLHDAYASFNARDIEGLLAMMTPDVEWPNVLEGRVNHGHAEARSYWTHQFEHLDPHVEPVAITRDGDVERVTVHQVVRDRNGTIVNEADLTHSYEFRGILVRRMTIQTNV
jgi:NAD(P)H-dependent FMN reductase